MTNGGMQQKQTIQVGPWMSLTRFGFQLLRLLAKKSCAIFPHLLLGPQLVSELETFI